MKELITVIIPIYNAEKWIERCVDSVLRQKYKNLEILLINDSSTDNSKEICKKMQYKDDRVKLICQKENKGVSAARNRGIELAKGDYIAFVDADDYIDNDMYCSLYENMKKENVDLSICSVLMEKQQKKITHKQIESFTKKFYKRIFI